MHAGSQLERGVPVYDLLAERMGKTTEEIIAMQAAGELGREEIQLLIDALGERNRGASDELAKTWDGIVSNLLDHWNRFRRMVMDSGAFDFLKGELRGLLDLLDEMAADGRLQALAETVGAHILAVLQGTKTFFVGAWEVLQEFYPWLEATAELLGGWDKLAFIAAALLMSKIVLSLVLGLGKLALGLGLVGKGVFKMIGLVRVAGWGVRSLGRAVLWLGRTAALGLVGALRGLGGMLLWLSGTAVAAARASMIALATAVRSVGRALLWVAATALANPLTWTIAGIAGSAWLIYRNWDGIAAWFRDLWGDVQDTFGGVGEFVNGVFQGDMETAVAGLKRSWGGLKNSMLKYYYLISYPLRALFDGVIKPVMDKLGLTEPIVAGWESAKAAVSDAITAIGAAFNAAWAFIEDVVEGLMSGEAIGAAWQGVKDALAPVLDWIGSKFQWLGGIVGPVVNALKSVTGLGGDVPGPGGASGSWGEPAPGVARPDGARALGGPVRAGFLYAVNEEGQEYFQPGTDGRVVPARALRAAAPGGSRGVSMGDIHVHAAPGQSAEEIARAVLRRIEKKARAAGFALNDGVGYAG